MYSPEDHARQPDPQALERNIAQRSIQIQHHQREALSIGIYQTPRVEDKRIGKHQRIHDVDNGRNVALPLYDAQMISKWTPPSIKGGSLTLDFLVPVKKGTAVSLRVFNVASDSTYKYKVLAGDVNVARPKSTGIDQDYFVAPTQEWVYGTRFADDPRIVRQFQVLQNNSGLSLASILSKDDSIKCMEIQISSPKCDGVTDTSDPQAEAAGFEICLTGYNLRPIKIQHMHSHDLVHTLKMRLQKQEGIPLYSQRVFLDGVELLDECSLETYGISGPTRSLFYSVDTQSLNQAHGVNRVQIVAEVQSFAPHQLQPQSLTQVQGLNRFQKATPLYVQHTYASLELDRLPHRISMDSLQMQDPNPKMIDQLRHMMDICPGGLVRQNFTLDDDPGQWNESYEVTLRIHLIDEERFETATGLSLDAFNNATCHAQNAFVSSDPAPRQFVRESEITGGLPSVAQMWEQTKRAKARARVSPDTTSNGRQVQLDIEGRKAKQSVGKLAKYLFICGK